MAGINRLDIDTRSVASKNQAQSNTVSVYQQDNKVFVQAGEGSGHILADRHCINCGTAFQALQVAAEEDRDGGLYALAVEQTEQRRGAMEQAAVQIAGAMKGAVGGPKNPFGVNPGGEGPGNKAEALLAGFRRREDEVELTRPGRVAAQRSRVASLYPIGARAGTEAAMGPEERAAMAAAREGAAPKDTHGHIHGSAEGDVQHDEPTAEGKTEKGVPADPDQKLTEEELQQVQELSRRDREVKAHEQAHKSAAGNHAGAISLAYKTGPDGKRYAVEGEVPVDLSKVKGDPGGTVQKMRQVQRAAMAPADPSAADRRVAARAAQIAQDAQADLVKLQQEEELERSDKAKEGESVSSGKDDESKKLGKSTEGERVGKTTEGEKHSKTADDASGHKSGVQEVEAPEGPERVRQASQAPGGPQTAIRATFSDKH